MCKDCGDMKHEKSMKEIIKGHNKKHKMGAIKRVMEKMKK